MCNIMAAVGGIALLAMMGGRKGKKEETQQQPMLPRIQTDYTDRAKDQADINKGLASDASSGIATSSEITKGKKSSPGSSGYQNPLSIPRAPSIPSTNLPTIGGTSNQKPVNY